jgi:hypothetical protein
MKNEEFFRPTGGRPAAGDDDDEKLKPVPPAMVACRTPILIIHNTAFQNELHRLL